MIMDSRLKLLWYNSEKLSLEEAVSLAKHRFFVRVGLPASHVALPPGEYLPKLAGLTVAVDPLIRPNYLEIRTIYQSGDIVCMTCGEIVGHNDAIIGVSHGYCEPCGKAAIVEVDAYINARLEIRDEKIKVTAV